MAQKINFKVAMIGIMMLAVFAAGTYVVIRQYNKDPEKLLVEAGQALEIALAQTKAIENTDYTEEDFDAMEVLYKDALNSYGAAFLAEKDPQRQVEMLFEIVDFHKIDNAFHPAEWQKVTGCWMRILTIDPKDIQANRALLDYSLESAKSVEDAGAQPNTNLWKSIRKYATELTSVMEEKGLDPEIYVSTAKARGALIIALAGQTTDPEKSANKAIAELQAVYELNPEDVDLYKYRAQAVGLKAKIDERNGNIGAVEEAYNVQLDILRQGIDAVPENIQAYTNLLEAKLNYSISDLQKMEQLESDYIALTEKFSTESKAFGALASYYALNITTIDKSIANFRKAVDIEEDSIENIKNLANSYFRKGSIYKDVEEYKKAAELLENALTLDDAQEVTGPRRNANNINRTSLLGMMAVNFVEIAYVSDEEEKKIWTAKLSETVHLIEQFFGSQENPRVLEWHGFIDLANGDQDAAILKLYNAYRQFRASAEVVNGKYISADLRHLPYLLARLFAEREEIGLYRQFLEDALANGAMYTSPQSLLDYSEVLLASRQYTDVITIVSNYKEKYPGTPRVNSLLVRAYPMAGEFNKARELLATMDPDEVETMQLTIQLLDRRIPRMVVALKQGSSDQEQENFTQTEIDKLQQERVRVLKKLLTNHPEHAVSPNLTAIYFMNHNQIEKGLDIVDMYLDIKESESATNPIYTQVKALKLRLEEPDPTNISDERMREITREIISEISDPKQKSLSYAAYHSSMQDFEKTIEYLREAYENDPDDTALVTQLFEVAIKAGDKELAKQYIDIAVAQNIDRCEGDLFKSKLDMLNKDYQNAIVKLNECLKFRPATTLIFLMRSQCYSETGNHQAAIDDAKTALKMSFLDGNVAKNYAFVISTRNAQLGESVTKVQRQELGKALRNAITSNPKVWKLQGMYADYIAEESPEQALAIRQRMTMYFPNLQTYTQLGSMALRMSTRQTSEGKKKVLLQIAEKAFQDAYAIEPDSQILLSMFSEYYRLTGQSEKASQLFGENDKLAWKFHLRDGQNGKALEILHEQYADDPEDTETLIGLMTAYQRSDAKDEVIRYSEELLRVDDNLENKLLQLQMFLNCGLASQVEEKLNDLKNSNTEDDRVLLVEAGLTHLNGKPAKALELLNQYVKKYPSNSNALQLRAQVNRILGELNKVITDLQKCMQLAPSPKTQYLLAQTQAQLGNKTIAIGILKEALKDGRVPVQARNLLESLYLEGNRNEDLHRFYSDTMNKYPDNAYWKLRAGNFLKGQGLYGRAEPLVLESWEMSLKQGGNANVLSEYLSILVAAKKYQKAQEYALKYIDGKFATVAYVYLGTIQVDLKDKEKALEYFYKALEKSGSNDNLISIILNRMSQHFDQKVVAQWCDTKLTQDPASIAANITMFRLYQNTENYDKSLKYINKCLESVDENTNRWVYFNRMKAMHLTIAYMKTSETRYIQQAIAAYEDVLKVDSKNTDIMNNLAYMLADNDQKTEDAVIYARTAHEALPNDTNRLDTYAYALYRAGDHAKAEELLLSAMAIHEQQSTQADWGVYKHLGMVQEALGKKTQALNSYKQALNLAGTDITAKEKEQIDNGVSRLTNN